MKHHKFFTFVVFTSIFFLLAANNTFAAFPVSNDIFVVSISSFADQSNLKIGETLNVTTIIKNVTNDTMNNITIVQPYSLSSYSSYVNLVKSPLGTVHENQNYTNVVMNDSLSKNQIKLNYLNFTSENFTLNFQSIEIMQTFAYSFAVNYTAVGSYVISKAKVTYYDHWGDKKEAESSNTISFTITEKTPDPLAPYLPNLVNTNINLYLIGSLVLGIVIIALISRILYGKNPLKI